MVKLRCQSCGRVVSTEIKESLWRKGKCNGCDEIGNFEIFGSEDDTYEDESEEEEQEEDEDDLVECECCGEEFKEEELIEFEDAGVNICKKCINKAYPRINETKVEYKEKIVEVPIYIDRNGNKEESNSIIPKIF
jgi:hypothetical protein